MDYKNGHGKECKILRRRREYACTYIRNTQFFPGKDPPGVNDTGRTLSLVLTVPTVFSLRSGPFAPMEKGEEVPLPKAGEGREVPRSKNQIQPRHRS